MQPFPQPHDASDKMVAIGQLVAEIFMFEIVDDEDDRRTDAGLCVYYKLTYEPSAKVS